MTFSIAIAQVNPIVGDVAGNLALVRRARTRPLLSAPTSSSFPNSCWSATRRRIWCCGRLVEAAAQALDELEQESASGPGAGRHAALARRGLPSQRRRARRRRPAPAALQARAAQLRRVRREARVRAGPAAGQPVDFRGVRLGLPICEDIWFPHGRSPSRAPRRRAAAGAERLAVRGREVRISGSTLARERASETGLPLVYVNQVGGQDELVFDGGSFVVNADGTLARQLPLLAAKPSSLTRWHHENGALRCEGGGRLERAAAPRARSTTR